MLLKYAVTKQLAAVWLLGEQCKKKKDEKRKKQEKIKEWSRVKRKRMPVNIFCVHCDWSILTVFVTQATLLYFFCHHLLHWSLTNRTSGTS